MKIMKAAIIPGLIVSILFWSCGCVKKTQVTPEDTSPPHAEQLLPPEPPPPKNLEHTIKWQGETLTRISRWYTGSGKNWVSIAEANPDIDHRRMKIGDTVLIPEHLLKTRDPMPVDYRVPGPPHKSRVPESSSLPVAEPSAPPPPEEIELFGPIDARTEAAPLEATVVAPPLDSIGQEE